MTDHQLSESMDLVAPFQAGTSSEEIEAALKGGSMPTSLPTRSNATDVVATP